MAMRKEKEDWVMKCGKEKGKGRLGDKVWQRERKRKTDTSSPSLPFPFSMPHCITQSSFSFLVATLHHSVFLLLSFCHTSSPSLPFPFSKEKEDWLMKCGKEKGKGRLGDEVWQRERKRKTG
jgi:cytochrome c556